jgi:hypothetical protein
VSDQQLKQQIRAAAEAEERESYTRRMPQAWLDALAPLGTDWQKPHLTQAPYLIVVFEQLTLTFYTTRSYAQEARVRDYYAAGEDMVLFRKVLNTK